MELRLERYDRSSSRTIGRLYLEGEFLCWTLEDAVRGDPDPSTPANEAKVPGATAIPAGRYWVTRQNSPRFGPDTLTLLDVPGFTHIRIHAGNRAEDTQGCILVGDKRGEDEIYQSRQALERLKQRFREGWLTITEE